MFVDLAGKQTAFGSMYPGYTSRLKGCLFPVQSLKWYETANYYWLGLWLFVCLFVCFILIKMRTTGQWKPALNLTNHEQHPNTSTMAARVQVLSDHGL